MFMFLADVVVAIPEGATVWEYLLGILVAGLISVAIRGVNNWAAVKAAEAVQADAGTKDYLKYRFQASLARVVANIANKELKELQAATGDGKVSKDELKKLGQQAIDTVVCEFKLEGLDLFREFGDAYLWSALRREVDAQNEEKAVEEKVKAQE